jgi:hypothetical protein
MPGCHCEQLEEAKRGVERKTRRLTGTQFSDEIVNYFYAFFVGE